ncbi:helix-turn-helix transcriptional regulator [Sporosarcina sp. 6E9]|uniref:helix-turn-helix domain-containing protein n=1 Tax=Sporosarcina sp. 6E9 TaxID=2819235 RepID=UPI001AC3DF92|nr:helix-turn-helix transcriptional regulator [Sporosarcina sp. 6E9]MBO1909720.1 helix-turn-helix transcriptional regulator [Microvirga sp. 3-52]
MYRNLKAEMARSGITMVDVAEFLDVRYATVNDKVNGKFRFYYDEAYAIKKNFFNDLSMEYLFEKSDVEEPHQ